MPNLIDKQQNKQASSNHEIEESNDMNQFNPSINQSVRLVSLDLSNNNLTDIGVLTLANRFQQFATLTSLKLSTNQLTHVGIQSIVDRLIGLSQLVDLDLSHNKIGIAGKSLFDTLISHFPNLRSLSLSNTSINQSISTLFENLKKFRFLRVLDVKNCEISDENWKLLCEALKGASVPIDVRVEDPSINQSTLNTLKELLKHSSPC